MTFHVRNEEIEEQLKSIGRSLKSSMCPGFGFALLIFSYEPGAMFYTSSAEREDMIKSMEELLQRLKSEV